MNGQEPLLSRRRFLQSTGMLGILTALESLLPRYARAGTCPAQLTNALRIERTAVSVGGISGSGITVNGSLPGPLLRFREGDRVTLDVTNALADEDTSIHWHGLVVPPEMDGVPGVSFPGIRPGDTFTYQFPLRQSGTYWYHSHSGLQEQSGLFGPLIIDPLVPEPFVYERDYVVLLSDWTFQDPYNILAKLRKQPGYYNYQRRTISDLFRDAAARGWGETFSERQQWALMRMDPTDIADVTGEVFTYLVNGVSAAGNWTGLFRPGERVRLRFINAAAATYFDVRIPGLPMTVVQADGQNVRPITVDEFRIAIAETYDVIVTPAEERAYTIFAEAMDRSGFARGTLAPRQGMTGAVPTRRPRPVRTMADMGMAGHENAQHAAPAGVPRLSHDMSPPAARAEYAPSAAPVGHAQHEVRAAAELEQHGSAVAAGAPSTQVYVHGPDHHGPGNSAVAMASRSRIHEPGTGLGEDGWKVLVYADLQRLESQPDVREPQRDVELHLTGNMDRYMWSFDGKTYAEAPEPIRFKYGERLRLVLVNDTMMDHPIHLHGMWLELENGADAHRPFKHTVNVKPAERLVLRVTADAAGTWALHCHILYHMETGMLRVVQVRDDEEAG